MKLIHFNAETIGEHDEGLTIIPPGEYEVTNADHNEHGLAVFAKVGGVDVMVPWWESTEQTEVDDAEEAAFGSMVQEDA